MAALFWRKKQAQEEQTPAPAAPQTPPAAPQPAFAPPVPGRSPQGGDDPMSGLEWPVLPEPEATALQPAPAAPQPPAAVVPPRPEPEPVAAVSPRPRDRSRDDARHIAAPEIILPVGESGRVPDLPALDLLDEPEEPVTEEPTQEPAEEAGATTSESTDGASTELVELDDWQGGDTCIEDLEAAQPGDSANPTEESFGTTSNEIEEEQHPMSQLEKTVQDLLAIDGATGAAVVDIDSGMALAFGGAPGFDLNVAAAGNSNVVRAKLNTMRDLGLQGAIEDIMITLNSQYHLINVLNSGDTSGLFIYLVLDRAKANLALARHKLNALAKQVSI